MDLKGGRSIALKRLDKALSSLKKYDATHNLLTYETSKLSAYIKFGNVSIREVYYAFKDTYGMNSGIIR